MSDNKFLQPAVIFLIFSAFYIFFQSQSVYGGDSGDLVSAAYLAGIPHPPGYPLYTFIGYLLSRLPFNLPAWRISLLSSLPAAGCLTVLFLLLKKITKNAIISIISVSVLAANYVFWLYSIVPEVFSLNNLFAIILIYLWLSISWEKNITRTVWMIGLFTGLAFVHHHTIIFLFPGFLYILSKNRRKFLHIKVAGWLTALLFFSVGLSPLIYLPLASRNWPALDWGYVFNLPNFIHLFTRGDYGTFISNSNTGNSPLYRLLSILAFFKFILQDFWFLGVLLSVVGIFTLRQKNKQLFWFVIINLTSLVFFIFYSSFILVGDLMVATFERFLLLPYLVLTITIAVGLDTAFSYIKLRLGKNQKGYLIPLLFFIYPLSILMYNLPRISLLKNDFTAENLARDILDTVPKGGILLLSTDTTVFDTQYYYYTYKYRPDIKLISTFMFNKALYPTTLKKLYPDLVLSDDKKGEKLDQFFEDNKDKFPVFTSVDDINSLPGSWLPYGVLQRYYRDSDSTPSAGQVSAENQKIWASYHDPLSGSLSKFHNLYSADILRIYSTGRQKYAIYALDNGLYEETKTHAEEMIRLGGGNIAVYELLGRSFLGQKNCQKAEENFRKMLEIDPNNVISFAFLRKTFLECYGDVEKAKEFENSCLQQYQEKQTQLKDL